MDIRAHIQIDAPADQAWSIIGEQFGHIGDWAAGIRASSLDGVPAAGRIRTCHIDGGGATRVLQERLLTFDTAGRSLSYQVVAGMPGFVRSAVNQWQVRATTPGTCVVSIHARFTLTPVTWPLLPPFRWSTRRTMAGILDQLRYRVENGTAHPDKTTTRLPTVAS